MPTNISKSRRSRLLPIMLILTPLIIFTSTIVTYAVNRTVAQQIYERDHPESVNMSAEQFAKLVPESNETIAITTIGTLLFMLLGAPAFITGIILLIRRQR